MESEGNVSGQEDDDAGNSGDKIDSANLLLNRNGTALSAEENEDKTASTSLLERLQSIWQNKKNIAAVVMLWTSLLSTLANKSLMTSFFPQEVLWGCMIYFTNQKWVWYSVINESAVCKRVQDGSQLHFLTVQYTGQDPGFSNRGGATSHTHMWA